MGGQEPQALVTAEFFEIHRSLTVIVLIHTATMPPDSGEHHGPSTRNADPTIAALSCSWLPR